jgi:hypothetical protein
MADKEAEKPWPLVVLVTNETPPREHSDEYPVAAFNALVEQLRLTALRYAQEAGRVGEVQRLELYCYNTKKQTGEE